MGKVHHARLQEGSWEQGQRKAAARVAKAPWFAPSSRDAAPQEKRTSERGSERQHTLCKEHGPGDGKNLASRSSSLTGCSG